MRNRYLTPKLFDVGGSEYNGLAENQLAILFGTFALLATYDSDTTN